MLTRCGNVQCQAKEQGREGRRKELLVSVSADCRKGFLRVLEYFTYKAA